MDIFTLHRAHCEQNIRLDYSRFLGISIVSWLPAAQIGCINTLYTLAVTFNLNLNCSNWKSVIVLQLMFHAMPNANYNLPRNCTTNQPTNFFHSMSAARLFETYWEFISLQWCEKFHWNESRWLSWTFYYIKNTIIQFKNSSFVFSPFKLIKSQTNADGIMQR